MSKSSYASVVNQKIQSRLLSHEGFRPFLHAPQALHIHLEHVKVEWDCVGCFHLLHGLFDSVGRAAGDVDSGAMESELECGFVSDP